MSFLRRMITQAGGMIQRKVSSFWEFEKRNAKEIEVNQCKVIELVIQYGHIDSDQGLSYMKYGGWS